MDEMQQEVDEMRKMAALMPVAPGWWPKVRYAPLVDAIYWSDEVPDTLSRDQDDLIRILLRFRTSLIMGDPDEEWRPYWEEALRHFPNWVGFSAARLAPNPKVKALYERESKLFDAELERWMSED